MSMNIEGSMTFIWYARDERDGELVLAIPSMEAYRLAYIYSPRIIFERIKPHMNPALAFELNLGPCGLIPREYYEEAGITVTTPVSIRLVAMKDRHRELFGLDENYVGEHDEELSEFILSSWNKFYKKVQV